MKNFITVKEAAIKWGISERRVQMYCKANRIQGLMRHANSWAIPEMAEKPELMEPGRKVDHQSNIQVKNVLSLFSGCGGMDLGFEGEFSVLRKSVNTLVHKDWIEQDLNGPWVRLKKNNFQTVFANDIRPDAKIAWVNYFSKKGRASDLYHLESIVDIVKNQRDNGIKIFPDAVDIVTGGFPCQDFSIAGKRKGFLSDKSHIGKKIDNYDSPSIETRGSLYIWLREVISLVKPKLFIAENVKGLASLENVVEIIQEDFRSVCDNGYIVVPAKILNAANYGVPQSRERIIFFGFLKSALTDKAKEALSSEIIPPEYDPYPPITHSNGLVNGINCLVPYVSVKDVFSDLVEPNESSDPSHSAYSKAKYMGKHCQGQTEVDLDGVGPTIRSEHHGNIEFRRLSAEHGGRYINELSSGMIERRMSVRECARIQTFPDSYQFVLPKSEISQSLSASDSYKLIGNAVPPLLAYHIARRIDSLWDKYFLRS